jgi:hypothetical protein
MRLADLAAPLFLSSHQPCKIQPGSTRCATDEVEVKVEACQGDSPRLFPSVLEKYLFRTSALSA